MKVIQLAKLSGFSPIITTSSLKHTDFLKSLGATHVLDRSLPLSKSAVEALTEEPVKVVYDAISIEETQQAGLDVLPSGGQLVLVKVPTAAVTERAPKEDKIVIRALGLKTLPQHVELLREFWAHATSLFESGDLKVNATIHFLPTWNTDVLYPAQSNRGFARRTSRYSSRAKEAGRE